MELTEAEAMAKRLIATHLGGTWGFRWDQAKTRLGACHHHTRTISLSRHYAELNGPAEILDTVLHEIAHALTPGGSHGARWKKVAADLGARPIARADARSVVQPAPRWLASCPACGATVSRYRRPSAALACASCCRRFNGGRFDRRFVLRWQPVETTGPVRALSADLSTRRRPRADWRLPGPVGATQLELFGGRS